MLNLIDWFRGGAPIKEELAAWCWAPTERRCWERLQRSPPEPQKMFQWNDKREREKKSGWEVVCIMVITWHTTAVYWRNLNYIHRSNPESSHRIAVNLETRCWKRCNSVGECYSAGESDRHQLQIGSPDCAFFFFLFFFTPSWTFIIEYLPVTSIFVYVFFHITAGQHTDNTVTIHQRPCRPVFSAYSEEQCRLTNRTSLHFL